MMLGGDEDEEKWLAEGIAGVQHNAFYMHRALVPSQILIPTSPSFLLTLDLNSKFTISGLQQFEGSS